VSIDTHSPALAPIRASRSPAATAAATATWQRYGGLIALAVLTVAGTWLAFAAATSDWIIDTGNAPEPAWANGPLAGVIGGLSDPSFSLLLGLMVIGYLGVLCSADRLPSGWLIGVACTLIALFTLSSPLLSSDIFGYVAYARLGTVHGLNPYLHAPDAAPHDPIYPLVYWQSQRTPYGPLFTLLTYPLGRLPIAAAVWTLKALAGVSAIAATLLTARAARWSGRSAGSAAFLLGANPLLLAYGVGGGHNDLLVAAAAAAGVLLLLRGRALEAGATLTATVAIKATGAVLLPFALVGAGARRRFLLGGLLAAAAVAIITLVGFGPHVLTMPVRVATSGDFVADWSGPDALGRLLGTGATAAVRGGCLAAAGLVVLWSLWRVWRGVNWLTGASWAILAVLLATPPLVPWYFAWLVPVAALAPGRSARIGVALLTVAMTITRLPVLGFATY